MQVITYLLIFPTNKIYEGHFLAKSFLEALLTCWHSQICKFQIYSFVFYCFVNFLCILLFLFFMYFIVFIIFYFLQFDLDQFQDIENCANGPKDRINTVLVHFKKICNFHVFCTQTNICKMQILGKFCADVLVQNVTWPRDQWSDFRKLGIKRCVRLERKKSWKGVSRSAAVARQSQISCRGGVKLTPPPQLLR